MESFNKSSWFLSVSFLDVDASWFEDARGSAPAAAIRRREHRFFAKPLSSSSFRHREFRFVFNNVRRGLKASCCAQARICVFGSVRVRGKSEVVSRERKVFIPLKICFVMVNCVQCLYLSLCLFSLCVLCVINSSSLHSLAPASPS